MYKNLLKACAIAIFAMGTVESAEGAVGSSADKWVDNFGDGQQSNVTAKVKAYLDADIFDQNSTLTLIDGSMHHTPQIVTKTISVSGVKNIKFSSSSLDDSNFAIEGGLNGDKLGFKVTVRFDQQPEKVISSMQDCMYELGDGSGAPISQKDLVLKFELTTPENIMSVHPDTYVGTIKVDFSAD